MTEQSSSQTLYNTPQVCILRKEDKIIINVSTPWSSSGLFTYTFNGIVCAERENCYCRVTSTCPKTSEIYWLLKGADEISQDSSIFHAVFQ